MKAQKGIVDLIEKGANVHSKNLEGQTPLMLAVFRYNTRNTNNLKPIELLLLAGARVDEKDNNNESALDLANKDPEDTGLLKLLEKFK